MANAKIIEAKAAKVAELTEKINKAQSIIFFDYRGLTVEEVTALRVLMRKAGVEYAVLKNSMFERAADAAGIDASVKAMLKGTNAFAFGYDDLVAPAKILKDFMKKAKKCQFVGGIIEGQVSSAAAVDALAELPPREVLIARILGSIMAPITGLAVALNQIKQKQEG